MAKNPLIYAALALVMTACSTTAKEDTFCAVYSPILVDEEDRMTGPTAERILDLNCDYVLQCTPDWKMWSAARKACNVQNPD